MTDVVFAQYSLMRRVYERREVFLLLVNDANHSMLIPDIWGFSFAYY